MQRPCGAAFFCARAAPQGLIAAIHTQGLPSRTRIRTFVRMSITTDLTNNQRRVLEYIRDFMTAHGRAPSLREIAAAMGLARHSSAQDYIRALIRKGALERTPQRGLRLVGGLPLQRGGGLPLIGRVAAGSPMLAVENIEGHYAIDEAMFRPRADYLLRVVGASMRDSGIHDGDLIAVQRTPDASHGQIVVARVDDEVTVKTLYLQPDGVRLLPANPDFLPIDIDPRHQDFAIEGRYVGLIRQGASS